MLVFDTDVLIALGCARGDIVIHVETVWHGQLVVPDSVRDELRRKVATDARVNCARFLLDREWVSEPVEFTDDQRVRIENVRLRLGGVHSGASEHQGESSIIVFCLDNPAAIAVLADRDATTVARAEGLTIMSTLDVIRGLVSAGSITCEDAFGAYSRMIRVARLPPVTRPQDFCGGGCSLHGS